MNRRAWAVVFLTVTSVLLGGCATQVSSQTPWFSVQDTRDAPAVRSGWWMIDDTECHFSVEDSNRLWPDCAKDAIPLPSGDRLILQGPGQHAFGLLLVTGDPPILQLTSPPVDPTSTSRQMYAGFHALQKDHEGRVTEFMVWPALCGEQGRPTKDRPYQMTTKRAWPGLVMGENGDECIAMDVAALREAVRRSPRKGDWTPAPVRWLRDWRPGDQTPDEWLAERALETQEGP